MAQPLIEITWASIRILNGIHRGFVNEYIALHKRMSPKLKYGKGQDDTRILLSHAIKNINLAIDNVSSATKGSKPFVLGEATRSIETAFSYLKDARQGIEQLTSSHNAQTTGDLLIGTTLMQREWNPSTGCYSLPMAPITTSLDVSEASNTQVCFNSHELRAEKLVRPLRLIQVQLPFNVQDMFDEILSKLGISVFSVPYVYEDCTERAYGMIIDDSLLSHIECKLCELGGVVDPQYNKTMQGEALQRFLYAAADASQNGWGGGMAPFVMSVVRERGLAQKLRDLLSVKASTEDCQENVDSARPPPYECVESPRLQTVDCLKDGEDSLAYSPTYGNPLPTYGTIEAPIREGPLKCGEGALALASYNAGMRDGQGAGCLTYLHDFLKNLFSGN